MPAQQGEIDQQRAALLSAIAQQGSQGQVAFQAEAARRQAAQQAAAQAITANSQMTGAGGSAPRAFTQNLQAQQQALGDIYAQNNAMANQTFNNSIAQTSAANAAYMDQARAAVPVVNAQTAGIVAQIRAEQEAARADREFRLTQMRLDAEEAQKEREFRQWEREQEMNGVTGENGVSEEEGISTANKGESALNERHPSVGDQQGAGDIFFEIADQANGFDDAMVMIDARINDYNRRNEDNPISDTTRRDMQRWMFEFFYGADISNPDPNDFGDQVQFVGGDPTAVPGYVPPDERAAQVAANQAADREVVDVTYRSLGNGQEEVITTYASGRVERTVQDRPDRELGPGFDSPWD